MQLRLTVFFILCFAAQLLQAELSVTTRFSQPRVKVGSTTQYIVEITASSDSGRPQLDPITSLPIQPPAGLRLLNGRTSQQSSNTRIMNGVAEYSVTQSAVIDASAQAVGNYTIPAFTIELNGETALAPAATLMVVETSAEAEDTLNDLIFLDTNLPEALYVGQSTDMTLKLYIADSVRLNRLSSFERKGDGFTISQLPEQTIEGSEMRDGRRYRVLSWPLTITPIQSGEQTIDFSFELTATIPGRQSDPYNRRRGFGGSLFDDFFERGERFPLSKSNTVKVLPLPSDGKPDSFSGAIGDFQMEVSTDLDQTKTGEPIMLSLKLTGEGNFDRIQGPKLESSNDWKVYAPESQMEDSEQQDSKRFDYVMIPKRVGALKTPEVKFAFFDPEKSEYIEYTSPSLDIKVELGRQQYQAPVTEAGNDSSVTAEVLDQNLSRALTPEETLLTLDYRPKPARAINTENPFTSTSFVLLNAAGLIALSALGYRARQARRLRTDPDYALHCACTKELKAARRNASNASNSDVFYQQAQAAIRLALSRKTKGNLRNAELNELLQHINSQSSHDATAKIFDAANAARFSRQQSEKDWKTQQAQLDSLLKTL
ncbi:MAG: BatD family protein [Coraliomargarita sp.]